MDNFKNPFEDDISNNTENSASREEVYNMEDNEFEKALYSLDSKKELEPIKESNEEVDSEEEPLDNSAVEETSEPKEESNEKESETDIENENEVEEDSETYQIKVNGEEFELTLDELKNLASKGINYTKKLQRVAPYRTMVSMLEENKISEEELNQFIEMRQGDKVALANFIAKKEISLDDLENQDTDDIMKYTAKNYGKEITPFSEKVDELKDRENYPKLAKYVNSLDEISKRGIIQNPEALDILLNDMDNGIFDEIYRNAEKQRLISTENRSMLDFYVSAANSHFDKMKSKVEDKVLKKKSIAKGNPSKVKLTGNVNSSKAGSLKVVNQIQDITDEDFKRFMENIEANRI